jgi:hypothetical protein
VYHFLEKTNQWNKITGANFNRITVDPNGTPYALSTSWYTYRFEDNKWTYIRGRGYDIDCGPDGGCNVIGTNRAQYKWSYKKNAW